MLARVAVMLLTCLGAALGCTDARAAAALQIQPVYLRLSESGRAAKLLVINRGTVAVVLQATAHAWSQDSTGKDHLEPVADILFTPLIMRIEPGAAQTIRLALRPGSAIDDTRERSFRFILEELPPPAETPGVMVRMRYVLPLFAGGEHTQTTAIALGFSTLGAACRVHIANTGTRHVRVERLEGRTRENKAIAVKAPLYVLAGTRLILPCPDAFGDGRFIEQIRLKSNAGDFVGTGDSADALSP